ncbi:polymer-forming cytoskeletal protein [Cytophagia bacterium CHB2]|nr:polymer-forming cytoskeletal protein [Cytophagia bacterium CHB2]
MMLGKKEMEDFDKGGDLNTIIGKGSIVEGSIKVQSSLRIDGRVKGDITATDSLVNAIVGGRIKGKVFASGKVVLEAKSSFNGEVKASKLVIDEGAVFDGVCSMSDDSKVLALPESADGRPRMSNANRPGRPEMNITHQ